MIWLVIGYNYRKNHLQLLAWFAMTTELNPWTVIRQISINKFNYL